MKINLTWHNQISRPHVYYLYFNKKCYVIMDKNVFRESMVTFKDKSEVEILDYEE